MKDKLRKLANSWVSMDKATSEYQDGVMDARCQCADALLAILDAEGDGGVVADAQLAARAVTLTRAIGNKGNGVA